MPGLTTIKPKRLKPGDTIGIIAPSSPFEPEALEQGRAVLHAMGFETRLANGIFEKRGYLAGDAAHRAAQLHQMFADETVQGVMCARGGYGALQILNQLDYDLVCTAAKPFVGFSDITALHQSFFKKTGQVTFHGPTVCTLARADRQTQLSLIHALTSDSPLSVRLPEAIVIKPGLAYGVVLGGNLATLCHLIGTSFAPSYAGAILVIEDTGEAPYRIDRLLTQMKLAGCFDGVAGVIVGDFKGCGVPSEIRSIIAECLQELPVPVLAGLPVGHFNCNWTLPLGVRACLDTETGELVYLETATSGQAA